MLLQLPVQYNVVRFERTGYALKTLQVKGSRYVSASNEAVDVEGAGVPPVLRFTKEPTGDSGRVPAVERLRQVIAASLAALTVL